MTSRKLRERLLALSVCLSVACVTSSVTTRSAELSAGRSEGLFGAVVQTMRDSLQSYFPQDRAASALQSEKLSVDPHPFARTRSSQPGIDALTIASLRTYRADSSAVMRERARELERIGVPLGDASTLSRCPGILAPTHDTSGCPESPTIIGVVGETDSIAAGTAIPILVLRATSRGKTAIVTSYIMGWTRRKWTLLGHGARVIVE